jgi:hypothetical protein
MMSIEGLLENEQGLCMGRCWRWNSVNLAMSLPSVLAWVLYFIHWYYPPSYNKFVHACHFWSLVFMQGFSVESKTSGISSSSTMWQDPEARYKSCNEVNMTPRSPGTKPEKMENSEDPVRKVPNLAGQGASFNSERNWRQGPTCRRGKGLEDSGTNTGRRRQLAGSKWAQAGQPRPADPAHFGAQSAALWPSRHSGYL